MVPLIAFLDNLGMSELMIVAVAALLLFGKRLPEVAQQAGATLAKFRKSLDTAIHDSGVEQEIRKIKSAMPTDMSVRDVARVAARKFENRLRDEVDIPPISLDTLLTDASKNSTATNTLPTGASEASSATSTGAPLNDAPSNGAPANPASTEAHPAPVIDPKPGVDPASQFSRSTHGVHPGGLNGKADADPSATNGATPSAPDADSVERAQQSGIQPRPLPPGSVPRE